VNESKKIIITAGKEASLKIWKFEKGSIKVELSDLLVKKKKELKQVKEEV
jgi:hypothetical protein